VRAVEVTNQGTDGGRGGGPWQTARPMGPERPIWNRLGYGGNGVHRVSLFVR
jgi:hypothetical protein